MPTFQLIEWAAAISNEAENAKKYMRRSEARNLYRRHASLERTRDAADISAQDSYKIERKETGWGGYKVHFTETCDALERTPAQARIRARHRPPDWSGAAGRT